MSSVRSRIERLERKGAGKTPLLLWWGDGEPKPEAGEAQGRDVLILMWRRGPEVANEVS